MASFKPSNDVRNNSYYSVAYVWPNSLDVQKFRTFDRRQALRVGRLKAAEGAVLVMVRKVKGLRVIRVVADLTPVGGQS